MEGWKGGWMEAKAELRIAYSNQKSCPVLAKRQFGHSLDTILSSYFGLNFGKGKIQFCLKKIIRWLNSEQMRLIRPNLEQMNYFSILKCYSLFISRKIQMSIL